MEGLRIDLKTFFGLMAMPNQCSLTGSLTGSLTVRKYQSGFGVTIVAKIR